MARRQGTSARKPGTTNTAAEGPTGFLVEMWSIDRVTPYAANPRKNDHAVQKTANSIREYGWRQPVVVDEAGVVIVGHTRLKAARSLGLTEVPVHVAAGLSPAKVRAYRIADNRTGEDADWDEALLSDELTALLEDGYNLDLTGFDPPELDRLLSAGGAVTAEDVDQIEVGPTPDIPVTRPGDRIVLGQHVLVCGDSTSADVWASLLGDERVDCVWTDPPYGVDYVGKTAQKLVIDNDARDPARLAVLLRESLSLALGHSRPGAAWWVAGPHGPQFLAFAQVLSDLGVWRQTVVWAKDSFVLGRQDMQWAHEALVYGWAPGAAHEWHAGRTVSTVWTFPRPAANRLHPTMKPVQLIEKALLATTSPQSLIVDPFGGSGSTMLACEITSRAARLIELSPGYCDVIVQRWEALTGQQAVRP